MTDNLFCEKLALERAQFQLAQLAALIRTSQALPEDPAVQKSLKLLLIGLDRDIRAAMGLLPDAACESLISDMPS